LFLTRRVAAVGPVLLLAGERRVEDADKPEIAIDCAQHMLVMLIKCIEGAGRDRVGLAALYIDDLAASRDTVVSLEVVFVVKPPLALTIVSWSENPILSAARRIRRLSQASPETCCSLPITSSRVLTIISLSPYSAAAVRGCPSMLFT
jgi:hypothetical protein